MGMFSWWTLHLILDVLHFSLDTRTNTEIFCWKNVSSFCSANVTHIFSAKNIRILYIESAKHLTKWPLMSPKVTKLTNWCVPCHTIIMEESNFNFRYVQIHVLDLDIPREKWLNCLQTVGTQIRHCFLWHLIWVCTVCQLRF